MSSQQPLQTYETEACQKVWVWLNYQIDHFKDNPNGYSPVHPATPPPRTSPRATTPQCSSLFCPRSPNSSPVIIFPGTAEPIMQNPTEIYQYAMEPAQEPAPSTSPSIIDILKQPPPPPPKDYPPFEHQLGVYDQQKEYAPPVPPHRRAHGSQRNSSPERDSPESPNSQSYKFDPIYIEEMKNDHTEAAYRIKEEVRRAAKEKRWRERLERQEERRLKREEEARLEAENQEQSEDGQTLEAEDQRRIEEAAREGEEANRRVEAEAIRLSQEVARTSAETVTTAQEEKNRIPPTSAEDLMKLHREVQQVVEAYYRNTQAMSMGLHNADIQPIEKLYKNPINTWPASTLPGDPVPSTSHDPQISYDAGTKIMNQQPQDV